VAKIIHSIEDLPELFLTGKPQFYRGALQSLYSDKDTTAISDLPDSIWVPTQERPSRFDHFEKVVIALEDILEEEETSYSDLTEQTEAGRQQYFTAIKQINDFNYADETSIHEAFNSVFKAPVLINLIQEVLIEDDISVRSKIRDIVGPNAESEEIAKWVTEQVSTGASLNEMFLRLQEFLLEQRQVIVGLEVLDQEEIDSEFLQKFEKEVRVIRNRLKFTLQNNEVEERRNHLKQRSVQRIISKLSKEDLKGQQVLVYGKFKLVRDESDISFRYIHPVSSLFGRKVSISTLSVPLAELNPLKVFEQSIGSTMILRIYGEIFQPLNTKSKSCSLTIRPIAIY